VALIWRMIVVLFRVARFLFLWAGGVLLVTLGTAALQSGRSPLPWLPEVGPAFLIFLGGLVLLAIPIVLYAWTNPGNVHRIGARQLLYGVPDLLIAWTYVAAFAAPVLIQDSPRVMFYLLPVEAMAAYTAFAVAGLGEVRHKSSGAYFLILGLVLTLTLAFVGLLSREAGSSMLFVGYAALTAKRLILDWLDPDTDTITPGTPRERHIGRCAMTVGLFVLIGLPVYYFLGRDMHIALLLGVFYFVVMAWLEIFWSAAHTVRPWRRP
jgi:hypothetical protein